MGMYDSLYDDQGHEWQTKAYGCNLDRFRVGDKIPRESGGGFYNSPVDSLPDAYQVRVLGGGDRWTDDRYAWATVLAHVLIQIPVDRDPSLLAVDYHGGPAVEEKP